MSNYFRIKFVDTAPYLAISGASPSTLPKVRKLNEKVVPSQDIASNASYETSLSYDATKLYIAISVADVQHLEAPTLYGWSVSEANNHIAITNTTNDSINIADVTVGYIDSTNAEVVKVVSTGGMPIVFRNAFKYTEDGTSYWYVVGITHTGWVSDLSTVGYEEVSPAVVLPTVSVNPWVYFTYRMQDSYYQFNSESERNIYTSATSQNSTIQYDSSATYAVRDAWYNSYIVARTQLQCFNNSGVLAVRNVSSESFRSSGCYYCTCSDSTATVVTVYDSSNNAFNAFKFTASGTDYYYVLDGTQTDWTDDLSSIGYRLPKILYLALNKSAVRVTELGPYTYGYELYNEDGSTFISSSLPTLLEAWSDSSESSKIADFSNRIGLVIKSNNVVLDGKGSYNTWVQRISVL